MATAAAVSNDGTAPTCDLFVKLGGANLDSEAMARVLEVSVAYDLNAATQLTLRMTAWDSQREGMAWVDDASLAPGTWVEVKMGYSGSATPVFAGEIVELELEATTTARAILTITAYDVLHRLGRGQRREVYVKTTYAGVVRKIAQEIYKLDVDAKDDSSLDPQREVVNQENLSDLEFLRRLADELGYQLSADGKKIVFARARIGEATELTIDAGRELVDLTARLHAADQIGGVDVLAFNSEAKQTITASEDNADSADQQFGSVTSRSVIVNEPLTSDAQARARAKAELLRIRNNYLDATGTCLGRMDMRAGMMVEITNLGQRFGGAYYATSVTHAMSPADGLRTRFTLKGQPR